LSSDYNPHGVPLMRISVRGESIVEHRACAM
jgi:hypothetical protein